VDYHREYTYDGDGLMLTKATFGDDEVIDELGTYIRDADGTLRTIDWDEENDGSIDARTTYTYDEEGYQTRVESDDGLDGTVDWWSANVYGTACIEDTTPAT